MQINTISIERALRKLLPQLGMNAENKNVIIEDVLYIASDTVDELQGRIQSLEMFAKKWEAFEFAEITMSEEVWTMQAEARALLTASADESEVGG